VYFSRDKSNRRPEAVQLFTACIALRSNDVVAYRIRGVCYLELGQLDDALADFRQALRYAPRSGCEYNNLGEVLRKQGKLDEAISCHQEAVRFGPAKHVDHRLQLGLDLTMKGRFDEAIACYHEAIRLHPDSAEAHKRLAWFLATCSDPRVRDPAQAVELARKAVDLAPQDSGNRKTLGVALYRAAVWKDSVAALEKSIELGKSGDAFTWFFLAMAYWRLGHNDEARAWYDKAVASDAKSLPQPDDEELRRFRAEAAALLGVIDMPADVFARP
jgi:superkiller protein 3